jgi:hypothetical protein
MAHLLDSDILIHYTNSVTSTHELIERIAPDGLAVSAVSYMEIQQGIGRSPHPRDAQTRPDELLGWVPLIVFGRAGARRCTALDPMIAGRCKGASGWRVEIQPRVSSETNQRSETGKRSRKWATASRQAQGCPAGSSASRALYRAIELSPDRDG